MLKAIFVFALASILVLSVTTSALAQQDLFSARVLAKGKKTSVMILVVNSAKSTQSIHEFEIKFTEGRPLAAVARGWDADRSGDTMTFTATRSDMGPGGRAIFIIKVSDPASSKFVWTANAQGGKELQTGEVAKVRIREPQSTLPKVLSPEVNVNKVKVALGEQLTVTGKGYNPNSQVIIYIDQTEVGRSTTDSSGSFNSVVLIPNNIGMGLHLIKAVDSANKSSVIQIVIEAGAGDLPPLEGGKLIVRTDKQAYTPGEVIKITGSAVLETPVSLQIIDPQGGIICGANPQVNNKTLLWDAACVIPTNVIDGKYRVEVKQIVHKTTAVIEITGGKSGTGTGTGTGAGSQEEDPGTLTITLDKEKYKVGDTAKITVSGARSKSIITFIIDGPGSILDAHILTVDESGSLTYDQPLSGSDTIGEWQITVKQRDVEQKKDFVARKNFTVEAAS